MVEVYFLSFFLTGQKYHYPIGTRVKRRADDGYYEKLVPQVLLLTRVEAVQYGEALDGRHAHGVIMHTERCL